MTEDETLTFYLTRYRTNPLLPPTLAEVDYAARVGGFAPRVLWERLKGEGVRAVKGAR